jgi:hypothetical protein
MHFGENQLSRSLIGLSPLPTGHPPGFQPWWVRASTRSYPRFTLPMGRSPRFGSRACDYQDALFGLAFATATPPGLTSPHTTNSQAHSSKGTQSRPPPPKEAAATLPRLVGTRFQVLFHSPPGVLFTFPSRYSSAIGHQGVFRLSGWSRQIHTEFLGLRATWETIQESHTFNLQGCYPLRRPIRMTFSYARDFSLPDHPAERPEQLPQPPPRNPCRVSHVTGLASSAFARHYSRNHILFSLPAGTEMFHFPAFPPLTL